MPTVNQLVVSKQYHGPTREEDRTALVALAKEGRSRPFTTAEAERISELCSRSEGVVWNNDLPEEVAPTVTFWTELVKAGPEADLTMRDKNVGFLKKYIVPHIIRVTAPTVEKMKAELDRR